MFKYVSKRIIIGIVTLFILATVTFFLMHVMPGSPFASEKPLSQTVLNMLEEKYGLNKPLHQQYFTYMSNLLKGDLGDSFKYNGITVNQLIARGFPTTFKLGMTAFIIAIIVGVFLGVVAAFTNNRILKSSILAFSTVGVSVPSFILGILMMVLFGVKLGILPTVGLDSWRHYIMPSIALALYPIAYISRMVKSNLTEVLKQDYIVMARSKGLSWPQIIWRHAIKNAILPVITYLGPLFAFLITGSFVVESLFSIPGIGKEFVTSITNRDYTAIMGLTIFLGALIITANIIVDIILAIVDPRIKLDK